MTGRINQVSTRMIVANAFVVLLISLIESLVACFRFMSWTRWTNKLTVLHATMPNVLALSGWTRDSYVLGNLIQNLTMKWKDSSLRQNDLFNRTRRPHDQRIVRFGKTKGSGNDFNAVKLFSSEKCRLASVFLSLGTRVNITSNRFFLLICKVVKRASKLACANSLTFFVFLTSFDDCSLLFVERHYST